MKYCSLILFVLFATLSNAQQKCRSIADAIRGKLISLFGVLLNSLQYRDYPPAILNKSGILQSYSFAGGSLNLPSMFSVRDCREQRTVGRKDKWTGRSGRMKQNYSG